MSLGARRRATTRTILVDRSLESLPLFRLSDSADDSAITYPPQAGGQWRVLPRPGDRLPGTFDQNVYVELWHRYHEAGSPSDGVVSFTLHAFLRSIGRRVDGRTYEQLRSALCAARAHDIGIAGRALRTPWPGARSTDGSHS